MTWLVPTLVAGPILAAALTLLMGRRLIPQRIVTLATVGSVFVMSATLLWSADTSGPIVVQLGAWEAPNGITLIVDRFSAIVLSVSTLMLAAVLLYAIFQLGKDAVDWWFHTKYLALTSGVVLSLVTGDLFNLFVGFEVMLVASYVLLTVRSGPDEIRATMSYVVINLIASALFLVLIAVTYGLFGTVNMADIASRMHELEDGTRTALSLLMLAVFGIKAALFPLFMWLPDSYPTAPTPVTAIFAGLLTKVGVFVIIRTQTLFFDSGGPSTLLLFVAGATMVFGVLGAIAQNDVKRILSFHIVSQIGYMIMGLGFLTVAGVAAAILYMSHHIIVKTGLFLVGGVVEREFGTGALDRTGGLLRSHPVVAAMFLPLAFSLAGLPPFSGFVAKLALVQEGVGLGLWAIVGVSLGVSLLTFYSMTKIWAAAFWGEARESVDRAGIGMLTVVGLVVAASIGVAALAGPLIELSTRAASELLDPNIYIDAVLGSSA
ncbi:MAG: proton-conducting transporter membrane subunit [bacterium]|nr:proton-conducting transporter membrane subunit [bacterium]